jgi:hypothetical protein
MPQAPSIRRWFQFGMGTLFVLVTAMALLFAMIVPAWRQRHAVAEIVELGGRVSYEYQSVGAKAPLAPAWLRDWLGKDYFQSVHGVSLFGREFKNPDKVAAALEQIASMPGVKSLAVAGAGLQEAHLARIGQLHALTDLAISGKVTDDLLAQMAITTPLKSLVISGTFTDAGLAHVLPLRQLNRLILDGQISGAGVASLKSLKSLDDLSLYGTIADSDLSQVATLTQLRSLTLGGTVTDAGMEHLLPLSQLENLTCGVTLQVASELQNQTEFDFRDVSPRGVIDYFGTKHGIRYRFDDAVISNAGISVDTMVVTDAAINLSLCDALERILKPKGLGFCIENDQLVITTAENAELAHQGINKLRHALLNLREVRVGW